MVPPARILATALALCLWAGPSQSDAQESGTPLMWGVAASGHLGDAPEIARIDPVPIVGPTNLRSVASGLGHAVARRIDGSVWSWGDNQYGELGVGTLPSMTDTPVQVAGLTGVTAVSTSYLHTLALASDGTAWAWGWNGYGQLGDGTTVDRFVPVPVSGIADVVALGAGSAHSLAVTAGGAVWAWGYNICGQLGDGTTTTHPLPAVVPGVPAATAVAAGHRHSLALATNGTVWAWGDNQYGQVGDGTKTHRWSPVQVPGLTDVTAIATGRYHSLAIKADGTVWGWGRNADGGMVGSGVQQHELSPVQVVGLTSVTAVAASTWHSLARRSDGSVWAWGRSGFGQCGRSFDWAQPLAAAVPGIANAIAVGAGNVVSYAALADGSTVTWGGMSGTGARLYAASPEQVPGAPATRSLSIGGAVLALTGDGSVWSWGGNDSGQLGTGTVGVLTQGPTQVPGLSGIVAVSQGQNHGLAVDGSGQVWSWGGNFSGQLGDGSRSDPSPSPALVPGLDGVVGVGAGWEMSLAIRDDGSVWAWGRNADGALGDGTTNSRPTPAAIAGLPPIRAVATQVWNKHCLALSEDGTVWAWGSNAKGSLGDGTTEDRRTPVQVQELGDVVQIALTTWGTSYALDTAGRVWSWGAATLGQLGDGSTTDRWLPAIIPGLENVVEIAAGDTHALARTASGQVLGWGRNDGGELGLGDSDHRWYPTPLPGLSGVLRVFAGTDVSGLIAACELGCSADAPASAEPMEVVQFAAAATMTSGCVVAPAFDWDFGDGTPHSSEQVADHWYESEGTFHWVLTVTVDGQSCTREGDVTIALPCTVSCSAAAPSYLQVDTPAAFVGSATPSHCTAGAATDWDFGDGSAHSSEPSPSHTYAAPGVYTWTFTATANGASCVRTGTITVLGPACTGAYNLIIPAAAHSNNAWQSDLDLYNVGADPASVDIALLKPGQANLSPSAMNVAVLPGQTLRIPDILGVMLPAANAALGIRFCSGSALVNSRFYNIGTAKTGTFGAIVPALPPIAAVTPTTRGVFHHLTYSTDPRTGYRVNLGFANASPFSVSVTVRLYGDDGALIGTKTLVRARLRAVPPRQDPPDARHRPRCPWRHDRGGQHPGRTAPRLRPADRQRLQRPRLHAGRARAEIEAECHLGRLMRRNCTGGRKWLRRGLQTFGCSREASSAGVWHGAHAMRPLALPTSPLPP